MARSEGASHGSATTKPVTDRVPQAGIALLQQPYSLRLHPAVRNDLARIAGGLAQHSGWELAERKLDAFAGALRRLALTPHKGTVRNEIAPGLRAIPAAGRGVIAFVVDDAAREVRVVAVGYAGSDWVSRAALRR